MTRSTTPVEIMPGSVTTSTRWPSRSCASAPIFAIAPGPNWMLALVLKMNGFMGSPPSSSVSEYPCQRRYEGPGAAQRPKERLQIVDAQARSPRAANRTALDRHNFDARRGRQFELVGEQPNED